MAAMSKKDMRRPDLIIPFVEPEAKEDSGDMAGSISSTMPMMALFTRNKMVGWVSLVFSIQTWLAETPEKRKSQSTPAYFAVLMSFAALVTCYMQLFLPPPAAKQASPAGPPDPAPP